MLFPYVAFTLLTLRSALSRLSSRASIGQQIEISEFAVVKTVHKRAPDTFSAPGTCHAFQGRHGSVGGLL
jgi:hypothetical protein